MSMIKNLRKTRFLRLFAALIMAVTIACGSVPDITMAGGTEGQDVYDTDWGYFTTTLLKQVSGAFLGGTDIGDTDEDGDADLVIGGGGTELHFISHDPASGWVTRTVYTPVNGVLAVHIADLTEEADREQILFGGFSSKLFSYVDPGSGTGDFSLIHEFSNDAEIWDVRAGEIIPGVKGPEIAVVHSSRNISVLYSKEGSWVERTIKASGIVRTVEIADIDPSKSGPEIVTGSEDGYVESFHWTGSSFEGKVLYKGDRAIRNIDVGDFYQGHAGNELIEICYSFNSGNASIIYPSVGGWIDLPVYSSNKGLEALAVGEFNPLHKGPEPVFAGYSFTVTTAIEDGGEIIPLDIWQASNSPGSLATEIVSLIIGDLYPEHEGSEVFIMGFDGSVRMTCFDFPGISLEILTERPDVPVGGKGGILAEVVSRGFAGELRIEATVSVLKDGEFVKGKPGDVDATYPDSITIDSEGDYIEFELKARDGAEPGKYRLELNITSPNDPSIRTAASGVFTVSKSLRKELTILPPSVLTDGKRIEVTTVVKNTGDLPIHDILLRITAESGQETVEELGTLHPGEASVLRTNITGGEGENNLTIKVECPDADIDVVGSPGTVLALVEPEEQAGSKVPFAAIAIALIAIIALGIGGYGFTLRRNKQNGPDREGEYDISRKATHGSPSKSKRIGQRDRGRR